jgi:hypothetical protein
VLEKGRVATRHDDELPLSYLGQASEHRTLQIPPAVCADPSSEVPALCGGDGAHLEENTSLEGPRPLPAEQRLGDGGCIAQREHGNLRGRDGLGG